MGIRSRTRSPALPPTYLTGVEEDTLLGLERYICTLHALQSPLLGFSSIGVDDCLKMKPGQIRHLQMCQAVSAHPPRSESSALMIAMLVLASCPVCFSKLADLLRICALKIRHFRYAPLRLSPLREAASFCYSDPVNLRNGKRLPHHAPARTLYAEASTTNPHRSTTALRDNSGALRSAVGPL